MEEVSVLIAKSQAGDKEAREVLIENNLGLVHHIVRRFLNRGCEAEDLFQIGSIGLMKAIDKFDLSYDVKFSTYAVPMITGEIKRFLRDDGLVKISRSIKENGWKVRQASDKLCHQWGREPTLMEIQEDTGLSIEQIVMSMEASSEVESLYKPVFQSDGSELFLVDQVVSNQIHGMGKSCIGNGGELTYVEEVEKEKILNNMVLDTCMEELGEMEKELICLRYFHDKTQVQVAKELGISQVQVSRLERKILIRMREKLK